MKKIFFIFTALFTITACEQHTDISIKNYEGQWCELSKGQYRIFEILQKSNQDEFNFDMNILYAKYDVYHECKKIYANDNFVTAICTQKEQGRDVSSFFQVFVLNKQDNLSVLEIKFCYKLSELIGSESMKNSKDWLKESAKKGDPYKKYGDLYCENYSYKLEKCN